MDQSFLVIDRTFHYVVLHPLAHGTPFSSFRRLGQEVHMRILYFDPEGSPILFFTSLGLFHYALSGGRPNFFETSACFSQFLGSSEWSLLQGTHYNSFPIFFLLFFGFPLRIDDFLLPLLVNLLETNPTVHCPAHVP